MTHVAPTYANLNRLYRQYGGIRPLANHLGVAYGTARSWLLAAGIPINQRGGNTRATDIRHATARQADPTVAALYAELGSIAAVAKRLRVSTNTARDRLITAGVTIRPSGGRRDR